MSGGIGNAAGSRAWRSVPRRLAPALAIALLFTALGDTASATPTVRLKAQAVPIPGFPATGNLYGAGAAIRAEYEIEGSEYGGFPPPLIGVNLNLPQGTVLNAGGFPECLPATLEPTGMGPAACPRPSKAGPTGRVMTEVAFGREIVPEEATIEPFYGIGGGIEMFVHGHSPVSLEMLSIGRYGQLEGTGKFGPGLISPFPLTETVQGAQDLSTRAITVQIGSAYKKEGRTTYWATIPHNGECPRGGWEFRAQLTFANPLHVSETGETVAAKYRASCPRLRLPEPEAPAPQTPLPGTGGAITAPSNAACVSRRQFTVHFVSYRGLTYREAGAYLTGKRILTRFGSQVTAPIDLRGLPKGTYVLKLTAVTTTGRHLSGTRTYHTCAARPRHPRGHARL